MDPVFQEADGQAPEPPKKPSIFFGLPCAGALDSLTLAGVTMPTRHGVHMVPTRGEAGAYNALWCNALNLREELGLTHYASIHSDVAAPAYWLDYFLQEMDRYGADVLAACIAIKDERGLTSTAVRNNKNRFIRRLTVHELKDLPETFCLRDLPWADPEEDALLLNNGLYVCRFDQPWVEEFALHGFHFHEWNVKNPQGKFQSCFFSEDWAFSEWCVQHGLKLYATRKVPVLHCGRHDFANHGEWGNWYEDQGDQPRV
jgi:hypothetical protein